MGRLRPYKANDQASCLDLELVKPARSEAGRQEINRGQHLLRPGVIGWGVIGAHATYRLKMRVALCPPKPNELLMAVSMATSRATFGT